jgi:hypothetical protein
VETLDGMGTEFDLLKDYFKANRGTPFILAFMILLLSAGTLLTTDRPNDEDNVANYTFYSLVIGIAIQAVVTIRESRKHPHSSDSKPPNSP